MLKNSLYEIRAFHFYIKYCFDAIGGMFVWRDLPPPQHGDVAVNFV